jgi:hypothetical protein
MNLRPMDSKRRANLERDSCMTMMLQKHLISIGRTGHG